MCVPSGTSSGSFSGSSTGKESACNAGDPSSIPGSGRSPGEGIDYPLQYSWASLVTQVVKNLPTMQETWFDPWVGKIPWRREWSPTPAFWPGEVHGQRSLVGYCPWGRKELDAAEQLSRVYTHTQCIYNAYINNHFAVCLKLTMHCKSL